MKNNVELLAPAGAWEALEAAVNAGADAVYLGGKSFGARAFADNFDHETMERAVKFCHRRGVRLYVTVNTLADDEELRGVASELVFLNNLNVDGIIVQDLGIIRLAHMIVPELPLHASTQMTVTNSAGVRFAGEHDMVRVVPARELSLRDLKAAAAQGVEIEGFCHGALCVCYSGQCLMSSMIGGRSGNRGRCAQPCRMEYQLTDGQDRDRASGSGAGRYLLSPKDLCALPLLPQMIRAGVCSYKIEGRMKRPEYVAVVTDVYRRALDRCLAGDFRVLPEDMKALEQIFSRGGFTTAWLEKKQGRLMMSGRSPRNSGVLIGTVESSSRGRAVVKLTEELCVGDGLEFRSKSGGAGTTVSSLTLKGRECASAPAGSRAEIPVPQSVRAGCEVYRTLDSRLMERAAQFMGGRNRRRVPVKARVMGRLGEPLRVLFIDEELDVCGGASTTFCAEAAQNRPLDEASLAKQLSRLGSTDFELESLEADLEGSLMVPVSEINEARRRACEALDAARLKAFEDEREARSRNDALSVFEQERRSFREKALKPAEKMTLTVWADTLEGVQAALDGFADRVIFGGDRFSTKDLSFDDCAAAVDMAHQCGKPCALGTPRIVRESQLKYFEDFFRRAHDCGADQLNIHNLGLWQLARDMDLGIPLWADMSLNIFNSWSLALWKEAGAIGATPSLELTLEQLKRLAAMSPLPLECLVQGPAEMMVSEHCAAGAFVGNIHKGPCSFGCREPLYLKDRTQARFRIAGDQFCRMHLLNSQDLCALDLIGRFRDAGIASLRIDARTCTPEETRRLTSLYRKAMRGTLMERLPGTTHGHYCRGVE